VNDLICVCVYIYILRHVRFRVFTAVTMKNVVFWHVTSFGSCKIRRFRGTYRLHHQVTLVFLRSVLRLLVTANVSSLAILVTLMMDAICSFETLVLIRAAQRNISENVILHIATRPVGYRNDRTVVRKELGKGSFCGNGSTSRLSAIR
jgi:hypothetical protein